MSSGIARLTLVDSTVHLLVIDVIGCAMVSRNCSGWRNSLRRHRCAPVGLSIVALAVQFANPLIHTFQHADAAKPFLQYARSTIITDARGEKRAVEGWESLVAAAQGHEAQSCPLCRTAAQARFSLRPSVVGTLNHPYSSSGLGYRVLKCPHSTSRCRPETRAPPTRA